MSLNHKSLYPKLALAILIIQLVGASFLNYYLLYSQLNIILDIFFLALPVILALYILKHFESVSGLLLAIFIMLTIYNCAMQLWAIFAAFFGLGLVLNAIQKLLHLFPYRFQQNQN